MRTSQPHVAEGAVFRLPEPLRRHAAALDARMPSAPPFLHVGPLPACPGASAFAGNGRIWITREAFRPDSRDGLRLIGHELAHLAQQAGLRAASGAPFRFDDPGLEATAEAFGEAFAEGAPIGLAWEEAKDAAPPCGPLQCSYTKPQHGMNLRNQVFHDDFGEVEEDEDDDEEDAAPQMQGTGGARNLATTAGSTATSIARPARTVVSTGVSAVNTVSGVLGGTGTLGSITGAVSSAAAAAMAPAAAVLGPAGIALAIADMALSAVSAAKTYAHMCALEAIVTLYSGKKGVRETTLTAIAYTLNKKNKKLKRKGISCIPILGSICNSVYTLGRTVQKKVNGTKGVERRAMSKLLWNNMLAGDPAAIAACEELLGAKTFGKIRRCIDGDVVLKKKMKSL
ncbi:eCIS core domain-containing protein [Plastoroseomonas hellenica]|uniref:eCIS core domain-containing protein n=1 Tax=Plastoroseomonas hellenica TaxID=2687306 RepID=UPI001BAD0A09|nr:DUF4157 domain-containing protein [Plastoroseomonas hellenica]MBR0646871.1 DUF4157 domain-containing protein [Plastoroseomonas hellenica]